MTNEERVRQEILTTKALAEYLVVYNDNWGTYFTSDGNGYYWEEDAIKHEIEWLRSESDT